MNNIIAEGLKIHKDVLRWKNQLPLQWMPHLQMYWQYLMLEYEMWTREEAEMQLLRLSVEKHEEVAPYLVLAVQMASNSVAE